MFVELTSMISSNSAEASDGNACAAQFASFVVIWCAVALFVLDVLRGTKGEALNPVA